MTAATPSQDRVRSASIHIARQQMRSFASVGSFIVSTWRAMAGAFLGYRLQRTPDATVEFGSNAGICGCRCRRPGQRQAMISAPRKMNWAMEGGEADGRAFALVAPKSPDRPSSFRLVTRR